MVTNCHESLGKALQLLRPFQRLLTGRVRFLAAAAAILVLIVLTARTINLQYSSPDPTLAFDQQQSQGQADAKDYRYAVLVDAGSSGSRVHIYKWPPHTGDKRQLLNIRPLKDIKGSDLRFRITPGLSSKHSAPNEAAEYLDPLLQFAAKNVPKEKHAETPLFVLATAGMRLLPLDEQEAILNDLREKIPKKYKFPFEKNNAVVITGKEEGIYSWIATNYLSGRFDHSLNAEKPVAINLGKGPITTRARTIGMLEMGGASVQIAFEITNKYDLEELKHKAPDVKVEQNLAEFNLGCSSHDQDHSYLIYVTTFLGLGANVAREEYLRALLSEQLNKLNHSSQLVISTKDVVSLIDPCLVVDAGESVELTANHQSYKVRVSGSGNLDRCRKRTREMLDAKHESSNPKCLSANSSSSCPLKMLQSTRLPFSSSQEFYGFSELWYTMEDVLRMGGKYDYYAFKQAAESYCGTRWRAIEERYNKKLYPRADRERLMHECFKAAWVMSVLHDGLRMPTAYKGYRSVEKVNGNSVQWTLGALLYRTRYFPALNVGPLEQIQVIHAPVKYTYSALTNNLTFFACIVAVCGAIFVYLRHLDAIVQGPAAGESSLPVSSAAIVKASSNERNSIEAEPLLSLEEVTIE